MFIDSVYTTILLALSYTFLFAFLFVTDLTLVSVFYFCINKLRMYQKESSTEDYIVTNTMKTRQLL